MAEVFWNVCSEMQGRLMAEGEGKSRAGPRQQGEDKGPMCKHSLPEWEWWGQLERKQLEESMF